MPHVSDRIREIVSLHLDVPMDRVTDSAAFIADLGADSLDTIELVMAFEDTFGCEIPDEVAESFVTVGDARRFIESKIGN
jgi:acyl carrier protein